MKNKLFYILCTLFCFSILSCNNDSKEEYFNTRRVFVFTSNALIKDITLSDKNGIFYEETNIGKDEFLYDISNRDSIFIVATAKVSKSGITAMTSGVTLEGQSLLIIYKDELENASSGAELKIRGPMVNK